MTMYWDCHLIVLCFLVEGLLTAAASIVMVSPILPFLCFYVLSNNEGQSHPFHQSWSSIKSLFKLKSLPCFLFILTAYCLTHTKTLKVVGMYIWKTTFSIQFKTKICRLRSTQSWLLVVYNFKINSFFHTISDSSPFGRRGRYKSNHRLLLLWTFLCYLL